VNVVDGSIPAWDRRRGIVGGLRVCGFNLGSLFRVSTLASCSNLGLGLREQPAFENNYFTEMCSGSEAGSYLRRIDCVYHSTLGFKVIKKKYYLHGLVVEGVVRGSLCVVELRPPTCNRMIHKVHEP